MKQTRILCWKFTLICHTRHINAIDDCKLPGFVNTTFIFSWYLITLGQEFAFWLRRVMVKRANISFYNVFVMLFLLVKLFYSMAWPLINLSLLMVSSF